jgi:hypothetical protein
MVGIQASAVDLSDIKCADQQQLLLRTAQHDKVMARQRRSCSAALWQEYMLQAAFRMAFIVCGPVRWLHPACFDVPLLCLLHSAASHLQVHPRQRAVVSEAFCGINHDRIVRTTADD